MLQNAITEQVFTLKSRIISIYKLLQPCPLMNATFEWMNDVHLGESHQLLLLQESCPQNKEWLPSIFNQCLLIILPKKFKIYQTSRLLQKEEDPSQLDWNQAESSEPHLLFHDRKHPVVDLGPSLPTCKRCSPDVSQKRWVGK